jgi:cobalt-zinc-cadmium efflux system outer membrane protein
MCQVPLPRVRARARTRAVLRAAAALVVVCVSRHAAAQVATPVPAEEMTAAQAIQEAITHNQDLIAKRADVTVTETQVLTARLRPNPVLSLGADHLDWLGTGFNDVNNGGPTEIAARVDVPVERGDKRALRIDEAEASRKIAEARVADAIRTLTETVALACADVSQADQNLTLARETLRTFEALATLNDQRVSAGAAAPAETR